MGGISYNAGGASLQAGSWVVETFDDTKETLKKFGNFSLLNIIVNTNRDPKNETSDLYSVNAFTGSISGTYEVPSSNIMDKDYSTPDETHPYELKIDKRGCPLVLDLDGDGVATLNIDDTDIYFNTQNSDFSTKVGWVSGRDGLLAVDTDNDGKITKQSELFGTEHESGFNILKNYDSNNDGIIDSKDTNFGSLKLWQDVNENGITDDGELKTLTQAGIASINLNSVKINDEQNNNTITGMSTYTKTDGTVLHIYNVNLAFNKIYTKYNGVYQLSADVLDMPWLRGYGQVEDLQLKMSQNGDLKDFVKDLSKLDDAKAIYDKMDEFLAKWIGCEDIPQDELENGIKKREIAILDKYMDLGIQGEVTSDKKVFLESAYLSLKNKIYADFIAQTKIGNAFEINYDYKTDSILYNDNTYDNLITNLPNQKNFYASYIIAKVLNEANCLDGNKLAYAISEKGYGASLISYLNSGFQILESGELEILNPNTPMYVIGTSGNDTITGTDNADIIYGMDGDDILIGGAGDDYLNGGNGNDTLLGGDGNDTLDGGSGDDDMQGGYGDDVYIYDGQGKDTVIDERWVKIARQEWYLSGFWIFKRWKSRWVYQDKLVDAGQDTIIFGDNVKEKDVSISRSGNDLILQLKDTDDKLTIKNWYASTEQRVEKFVFADGFVVNSDQIINMITDTSASESLIGSSNPNFIVSSEGNDTVTGGKGDDAIINFNGNTVYNFNLGDGNDIIMDYSGLDKIKLGSGIAASDVKYVRNNQDLIISIKDMTESVTILNWFENDDFKIENIEFLDGTSVSSAEIMNLISTTVATGYDDVIIGNDEDNLIDGLSGNDYIEGRGGNDTIIGGLGKDIMKGGLGDDSYYVDNAGDKVVENENEGIDTIYSSITYELSDNVENLTLIGSGNINAIGNSLNNIITGNDGDNIINSLSGTNTIRGGKGNDTYLITELNQNDVIEEKVDEGTDTVRADVSYTLAANVENLILTGDKSINGTGNESNNYLEGNSAANILQGGAGNDVLYGNGGNDTLIGGTDDDTYLVDSADVIIRENVNEGIDSVISTINYTLGDNLENLELAGSDNLNANGNSLNNVIAGNDGDNIINGGLGNDTLMGGKGSDVYLFNIGDGEDTIIENDASNEAVDVIRFGETVTKDNTVVTKDGYDIVVTFKNSNDKITIKNSNINTGARIERFEFADGSYIDGKELYVKSSEHESDNIYSDFGYINVNYKSSAVDREYDDDGNLTMERTYNEKGYISNETYFYPKSGRNQCVKNYNSIGQITDITNYNEASVITDKTEYFYDLNNILIQEKSYEGKYNVLMYTTNYSYNAQGLLSQALVYKKTSSYVYQTINYTYDSLNRILTKETYNSVPNLEERISYTYNANGDVTNKKTTDGYYKPVKFNSDGTMDTVWTLKTAEDITYTYNAGNQLLKETVVEDCYTNKTVNYWGKTFRYNEWSTRVASETTYTYSSDGKLTNKDTTIGYNKEIVRVDKIEYEWDYRPSEQISYSYDTSGRIIKETVNSDYVIYNTFAGKQYKTWSMRKAYETTYSYNEIGNIVNKKEIMGYNKAVPKPDKLDNEWAYRTTEEHTYTYNNNGQVICDSLTEDYMKTISSKVGSTTYTYPEWFVAKTTETRYTYDKYCRLIETNIYKSTSYDEWKPYLYEKVTNTYDDDGKIVLTEYKRDNSLVDVIKYDYAFDENGYLIKQTVSKGKISNGVVVSYEKIEETVINSYYNKLNGGNGSDTLTGGAQNDELFGNGGNDFLYGNNGDDILNGGAGADLMAGGKGNDTYFVDNNSDRLVEYKDEGIDTVNVVFDYTLAENFENLTLLTDANLNGTGNSADNILLGNAGINNLYGLNGNDTLIGGSGNDFLYGGNGNDVYVFAQGDGVDNVSDDGGNNDVVRFDSNVDKTKIAFFKDGNDLIIDYGDTAGLDSVIIKNQSLENNSIEKIELSDGSYISDDEVNKIIQNMVSYAANNGIEFTNVESVKNNPDLMNLVSSSWHV